MFTAGVLVRLCVWSVLAHTNGYPKSLALGDLG